jgi:hypothetical protein
MGTMAELHSIQPAQNRKHPHSARRARQYEPAVNDFTEAQWLEILTASEGQCFYCREFKGVERLIVEHMLPLSRGGNNTSSNVVASCRSCNCKKGTMTPSEFDVYKANSAALLIGISCGHSPTPENVVKGASGKRYCLTCRRIKRERRAVAQPPVSIIEFSKKRDTANLLDGLRQSSRPMS